MGKKKEENNILKLLSNSGAAYRGQGIVLCIQEIIVSPEVAEGLKSMKNDNVNALERPISSYAIVVVALDIFNIEKYKGNDTDIQDLIKGLPIVNIGNRHVSNRTACGVIQESDWNRTDSSLGLSTASTI